VDKLDVNLLLFNVNLYERKVQMNFEICFFIFFKFNDFKIFFEILRTSSIPIVQKITLYNKIILQLEEIVYIRIDYIGLFKGRSFIIIKIYLIASNDILNFTILKIAILIDFIKKALKIDKSIYIATIYEYTDIVYFIIGNLGIFAVLTVASAAISELLSLV